LILAAYVLLGFALASLHEIKDNISRGTKKAVRHQYACGFAAKKQEEDK